MFRSRDMGPALTRLDSVDRVETHAPHVGYRPVGARVSPDERYVRGNQRTRLVAVGVPVCVPLGCGVRAASGAVPGGNAPGDTAGHEGPTAVGVSTDATGVARERLR